MVGAVLTRSTAWRNVEIAVANLRAADCLDATCHVMGAHRIVNPMPICTTNCSAPAVRAAPAYNEYHALIVQHAKAHRHMTPRCASCPLTDSCALLRRAVASEIDLAQQRR